VPALETFAAKAMTTPNYIYLGLAGDFDPDAVAREIDLPPTESAAKHSRNAERKLPRCSLMRFGQTHAETNDGVLDIYALAEKVVEQLEPYTLQFAEAITKHTAEATFQVVFEFPVSEEVSTPILGFSARVIRFVAATGASIDMDSYRTETNSEQAADGKTPEAPQLPH
jgi:hypothetical protein